ncbi:MAG: Ig-like domain-containing protein [Gemmatimonadaceae bacterium]
MNVARYARFVTTTVMAITAVAAVVPELGAQAGTAVTVAKLVADSPRITIKAGQSQPFKVTAYDAKGNVLTDVFIRVGGPRLALQFTTSEVRAFRAGSYTAVATAFSARPTDAPVTLQIPVLVTWPALTKLTIVPEAGTLYSGVMLAHAAKGYHEDGRERLGMTATWRTSDGSVAKVDRFGNVTALKPGSVTITAEAEGLTAQQRYSVAANPVASIDLAIKETTINTGDVVHLNAKALRANGAPVNGAKIDWSFIYTPDDTAVAPGGAAIIDRAPDGTPLFAANAPGHFTLVAQSGQTVARTVLDLKPLDARRRISITGRGMVQGTATSDLWPWTGKDGRDYCLVGTWGGDG